MDLRAGQRIDHYTLLEPLGEGGQGSVWKVLDPRDGGVVRALKLVSLAETGPAAFERARREARILAAADHPALVTCYGLFEDPRAGLVGLVMDLVPGESLAELAEREQLDGEHLDALIAQLADALAAVHGRGLVHRDLKPENVLVTDAFRAEPRAPGAIKLVDFGIAAPAHDALRLTATGHVIGTLPYLAPELIDPASWGRTEGPARDVFALGVLAYQLRFGKHPTKLGPGATMIDFARAYKAAEAQRIPWPPTGLTGPVGAAVAACLALRPASRPRDGAAVLALLRAGTAQGTDRGEWSGAGGPTITHRESTARAPAAPPCAERTEPMPAPPSSAPTIAQAPAPFAMTPGAARTGAPPSSAPVPPRDRGMAVSVAVGALAALVVVVVAFVFSDWWSQTSPPPPTAAPPTPSSAPSPDPTSTPPPAAVAAEHGACCRRNKACLRERSHFTCPDCTGEPPRLDVARSWRMRIGGTNPDLGADRVCARVKGSPEAEVCVPVRAIPDITGAHGRPRVSLDDIDAGNLVFTLFAGRRVLAVGEGRRGDTRPVLASALCMGLSLHVGDRDDVPVTVYLDDP